MTDTAREPIAYLWQHKETGRVYYQGSHDEAPQATYALIGPLFLEPRAIPPREPTAAMCAVGVKVRADTVQSIWRAMYDAAIAEKGKG